MSKFLEVTESLEARKARCEKENICFISLGSFDNDAAEVNHTKLGMVKVKSKFVTA